MLGHKTAAMTLDLYGHLWDRRLDEVALAVDKMPSGVGGEPADGTPEKG